MDSAVAQVALANLCHRDYASDMTLTEYIATYSIVAFGVLLAALWQSHEEPIESAVRTLLGSLLYVGQLGVGIVVAMLMLLISPVSQTARQYSRSFFRYAEHAA